MAINMVNKRAKTAAHKSFVIADAEAFSKFWEPGAKDLKLKLVPKLVNLKIVTELAASPELSKLVDELRDLRHWFGKNVPKEDPAHAALPKQIDAFIEELVVAADEASVDLQFSKD
jgi:hypothetical protein